VHDPQVRRDAVELAPQVHVHLSNLRRKLDSVAPDLRIVHTVRGVGFRISNELLDAAEAHASTGIPAAVRNIEPEPEQLAV